MNYENDNYTDDDAFVVEMMDGGWHWIGCDLLCPTVGQLVLTSLLMLMMMMMTMMMMTMMRMAMMMAYTQNTYGTNTFRYSFRR